jgi:hypothetical protein
MITPPTKQSFFSSSVCRFLLLSLLGGVAVPCLAPQELKHRTTGPLASVQAPAALDVVSHQKLAPPLLGNAFLRFSPDGSRLLLQNGNGLFVLSRSPLQILMYADIGEAYQAKFSGDSGSLSVLGRGLLLTTWQ